MTNQSFDARLNAGLPKFPASASAALLLLSMLLLTACGGGQPPQGDTVAEAGEAAEHEGEEHEGEEHAGEEDAEGTVELTAEQIEHAGIATATAGPATLHERLPLYGVIAPNAERVAEVTARFPGVIRSVRKRVGDPVRRGDTLATVESNESLQTYAVTSPLAGVVTRRNANEGAQTSDGPLFTVADLSSVWAEMAVFPRDIAKVRTGQAVRISSADTGLSAEGKVVYVAPFGSSANQTVTARVQLPNPEGKWLPGLYVGADVMLSSTDVPLAVRNEALQTVEDRSVVFVVGEHGFGLRPVKTGRSDGEFTEVLAGLAAGETFATTNSFILKAELGKGEAEHGH